MGSQDSTRMVLNSIFLFGLVVMILNLVSHADARQLGNMPKPRDVNEYKGEGKMVKFSRMKARLNLGDDEMKTLLPFNIPFAPPIPPIPFAPPIPQLPLPQFPPIPFPPPIPQIPLPQFPLIPQIPQIFGIPPVPISSLFPPLPPFHFPNIP
ncbi:hypothetical protein LOK49_LG07G01123 [Camellia lanceoleosa]|uniref:Uncharacterized protein n=1 Tax=Camellia lanceoleosa TaxID=1840588 RepID=A0ACC0H788_9ERIC|nr:hypothetical protein LOK49_LG07G01123 [Camellia lanceoleosa]